MTNLDRLLPIVNWRSFLERIVGLGDVPLKNFETFEVLINAPDYLKDLRLLLQDTSEQTLHNYLLWRIGTGLPNV